MFNNDNLTPYVVSVTNDYVQTYCYNSKDDDLPTIMQNGYFTPAINRLKTGDVILVNSTTKGLSARGMVKITYPDVTIAWSSRNIFEGLTDGSHNVTTYLTPPPGIGRIKLAYCLLIDPLNASQSIFVFKVNGVTMGTSIYIDTNSPGGTLFKMPVDFAVDGNYAVQVQTNVAFEFPYNRVRVGYLFYGGAKR